MYAEQRATNDAGDATLVVRRLVDGRCGRESKVEESFKPFGVHVVRDSEHGKELHGSQEGFTGRARRGEEEAEEERGDEVKLHSGQHAKENDGVLGVKDTLSVHGWSGMQLATGHEVNGIHDGHLHRILNVGQSGVLACSVPGDHQGSERRAVIDRKKLTEDRVMNVGNGRCTNKSCDRREDFGMAASRVGACCGQHAEDGMTNIIGKRCAHESCSKIPEFAWEGSEKGVYCKQHAEHGMVNVRGKWCAHKGCRKTPGFATEGSKKGVFCRKHVEDGMVNVADKLCAHEGCKKTPAFGPEGVKKGVYCRHHAEIGMVNVHRRLYAHEGCRKTPTFAVEGSKKGVSCREHAEDGMVKVCGKRFAHEGCRELPGFLPQRAARAACSAGSMPRTAW